MHIPTDRPFWVGDREFSPVDLVHIQITVRRFSRLSRQEIMATICENLPWKAPNGRLKLAACRQLLQDLEKQGLIQLPPLQESQVRHQIEKVVAAPVPVISLRMPLAEVRPVTVDPVDPDSATDRSTWNATMAAYHRIGYRRPIGAHQRYWIRVWGAGSEPQIVGALLFGAAAKALADRDRFIGWTAEERSRYRWRIVNNTRFLILPGIEIPHLASHVLGMAARRIRADWRIRYGYEPVMLETFIEPPYAGTSYRAANWICVGETQGRGRQDRYKTYSQPVKTIWVYPLMRDWRTALVAPSSVPLEEEGEEALSDAES